MYTSFRVKNFRGFEDLAMTDLKRINLIAGKNNTGKTSLLEAVGIHGGRYNYIYLRLQPDKDNQRLLRSARQQPTGKSIPKLETVFYKLHKATPIQSSAEHSFSGERVPPEQLVIEFLPYEKVDVEVLERISAGIMGNIYQDAEFLRFTASDQDIQYHYLSGNETGYDLLWTNPPVPFASILILSNRPVPEREQAERFSELKRSKRDDFLINTLCLLEERLKNLEYLSSGIHADIEGLPQLIPLSSMGEGMVRLTSIVLAISAAKDGVVLIDEIENGLHYSVQVDVWKAILFAAQQFNVQIFATTHSYEMIRAAYEAFADQPNEFRYHRLDRHLKTGKIIATTYDVETLEAAVETRFEVR